MFLGVLFLFLTLFAVIYLSIDFWHILSIHDHILTIMDKFCISLSIFTTLDGSNILVGFTSVQNGKIYQAQ